WRSDRRSWSTKTTEHGNSSDWKCQAQVPGVTKWVPPLPRKTALLLFQLPEDLPVVAPHVVGDAPDVDRADPADHADVHRRRIGARVVAAPVSPAPEQNPAADLHVDALRHVDVRVAEADEDAKRDARVVDR